MNKKSRPSPRLLTILWVLVTLLACQIPTPPGLAPTETAGPTATTTQSPPTATTPAPTTEASGPTPPPPPPLNEIQLPENVYAPGFGGLYKLVPVQMPAAFYQTDYTLPVALGALTNGNQFALNPQQSAQLSQNGFVVTPAEWQEFFQVYERVRYQDKPVFITTDSIYHVYHLLFDKLLRDLERDALAPTLEELTNALVEAAGQQYEEARGTALEFPAQQVWAYFAVPQQLLSATPPPIPAPIQEMVSAELAQIYAHDGIWKSPLLSLPESLAEGRECNPNASPEEAAQFYCEDYSQYVPRGHYTRDEQLQRYFRAMMWYGRINLRLQYPRETRLALLITRLVRSTSVNGRSAMQLWYSIYDPTCFLVGKADDLGVHEYGEIMDSVYGPAPDLALIADDAWLNTFTEVARQLPPPQINSMWVYIWEDEDQVTQGFRFMGQRFVLDAYIFEQLIHREVDQRWLPMGLDVFSAMGNAEAYTILDELGETDFPRYESQMATLRQEIGGLGMDSWSQNLYWSWLYALQAVVAPKGDAYPPFMQTQAWARRDLHTALGSWTELKHDTILYAKQVMAELGGGGMEEIPHGYVEPNPEAYARLLALTRMTFAGLDSRGILSEQTASRLNELDDTLVFLQSIAERELAGEAISDDEYDRIMFYGGWLESMTLSAADTEEDQWVNQFNEDEQAAIVADVATDPNGYVLEEGTGHIFEIYAVVPDGRGGLQIAEGGSYSYYEFRWPIGNRLTDEQWRSMLTDGVQPPQPTWVSDFIVP